MWPTLPLLLLLRPYDETKGPPCRRTRSGGGRPGRTFPFGPAGCYRDAFVGDGYGTVCTRFSPAARNVCDDVALYAGQKRVSLPCPACCLVLDHCHQTRTRTSRHDAAQIVLDAVVCLCDADSPVGSDSDVAVFPLVFTCLVAYARCGWSDGLGGLGVVLRYLLGSVLRPVSPLDQNDGLGNHVHDAGIMHNHFIIYFIMPL